MKEMLGPLIAALLIAAVVVNGAKSTRRNVEFNRQVEQFMQAGGRNTKQHGYDLCERINKLERIAKIKTTDCKQIYIANNKN